MQAKFCHPNILPLLGVTVGCREEGTTLVGETCQGTATATHPHYPTAPTTPTTLDLPISGLIMEYMRNGSLSNHIR